ncbi:MAG: Txe/YoeB family addiction module toxin [Xanthomonadales bacterium]|jgi:toxin YoeB|nr:Txe/YoeB family addiction module toxin [Xanthomonadales bacterium]
MVRKLAWTQEAWADYIHWQRQDTKTLRRINRLVTASLRDPHSGVGKPELLKGDLSGLVSRRIDHTNRLVYAVDNDILTILSCRYHY